MSDGFKKYYAVRFGRNPGIYVTWPEAQKEIAGFTGAIFKSFTSLDEAQSYMCKSIYKIRAAAAKSAAESANQKQHNILDLLQSRVTDIIDPKIEADELIPRLVIDDSGAPTEISQPSNWTEHLGQYYIFTDGSFNTKTRLSAWAVYFGPQAINLTRLMPVETTNNKCELLAIKVALESIQTQLEHLKAEQVINIVTDSKLCVDTFTKWIESWRAAGWKLKSGNEPKNLDEVQAIDRLLTDLRGHGLVIEFVHQAAHMTVATARLKTIKSRILWQGNYIVDHLAQKLTQ